MVWFNSEIKWVSCIWVVFPVVLSFSTQPAACWHWAICQIVSLMFFCEPVCFALSTPGVSCVTAACWRSAYNATKCSFHNITLQRHPVVSFQQKQWLSQCKPCTGWLHYLGESFLNLFIVRILICWCFSLFFNTIWMWKY